MRGKLPLLSSLAVLLPLSVLASGCCSESTLVPLDRSGFVSDPTDGDSSGPLDDETASRLLGELLLSPAEFDFGERPVACSSQLTMTVSNMGDGPLEVTGMSSMTSPGIEIGPLPDLPIRLDPNASVDVGVRFTPINEQGDEATFTVFSDAGDATAELWGSTLPSVAASDEFIQEGNRAVDILWMVDSSGSMASEQESLGDNFSSFISIIDQLQLDYRVGVITSDVDDGGALHGAPSYITPETPSAAEVFAENVLVGQHGSGEEQGFDSVRLALLDGAAGDFLRSSAQLRVISVSDEDDQSDTLPSTADYVAELRSLKTSPRYVIHSDIVGGVSGCSSADSDADPAPRYLEATALTGGISRSICDENWVQALEDLAWLADSYADTFTLSQPAVAASVTASVDGIEVDSGWSFDSSLNAVIFDEDAVPEDGSVIFFDYLVQQPCHD